ncbi:DUF1302 domain-containing protein [Pseudomonas hunanensis]|uniref:DUF1302 domain-containing protein n=1 Tax=Pseudomonas hunanensis TaxID=1247546 RepID=UPI0030D6DB53
MKKNTAIVVAWVCVAASHEACAFSFETPVEDLQVSLDSVVEYSAMYRTAKQERIVRDGQNIFANANDGSEYYSRGLVSNAFKITSELSLKMDDDGFFVRGSAWYDTQLMDHKPSGGTFALNNTDSSERYPSDLKNRFGQGARLLDAYVYGNRDFGDVPVNLRVGRQVINWGEGLFYADGLNVVNPVDVGRIVLPGASLKEALLPTNMISFQAGLTESISLEGFYGLEWRSNEVMPTGAFLNNADIFGKGTNGPIIDLRDQLTEAGIPLELVPGVNGVDGVVAGLRYRSDRDARDDGQFGIALRFMAEEMANAEFSLYYLNYHSKVPFLSIQPGQSFGCSAGGGGRFADLCGLTGAVDPANVPLVDGLVLLDTSAYDLVYPEDIRLFGFTASGNVGDTNFGFELTYRPNAPIEPSMSYELEQLANGALLGGGASGVPIDLGVSGVAGTDAINLYKRKELYTSSVSVVHAFGPSLGLDALYLVSEVAANYVPGSYTRTPNYAYLSPFAWGYTMSFSGTIENALPGIDLLPGLTFREDVSGTSPALNENFIEGRKSSTVQLGAQYGESLNGKLAYTVFWGARKDNPLIDRDNIALNVSYSF